jgi:hypothetical protein
LPLSGAMHRRVRGPRVIRIDVVSVPVREGVLPLAEHLRGGFP